MVTKPLTSRKRKMCCRYWVRGATCSTNCQVYSSRTSLCHRCTLQSLCMRANYHVTLWPDMQCTYTFIFHRDSSDSMFADERWRHHEPQSEPSVRAPEDEQWQLVQTYPHGLHEHAAFRTGKGVRREHVPVAPAQNWDRVLPPIVRKTGVSRTEVIPRKCLSLSGGLHTFFICSFLGPANLRCFVGFLSSRKMPGCYLRLDHDRLLPHPYQFIIY